MMEARYGKPGSAPVPDVQFSVEDEPRPGGGHIGGHAHRPSDDLLLEDEGSHPPPALRNLLDASRGLGPMHPMMKSFDERSRSSSSTQNIVNQYLALDSLATVELNSQRDDTTRGPVPKHFELDDPSRGPVPKLQFDLDGSSRGPVPKLQFDLDGSSRGPVPKLQLELDESTSGPVPKLQLELDESTSGPVPKLNLALDESSRGPVPKLNLALDESSRGGVPPQKLNFDFESSQSQSGRGLNLGTKGDSGEAQSASSERPSARLEVEEEDEEDSLKFQHSNLNDRWPDDFERIDGQSQILPEISVSRRRIKKDVYQDRYLGYSKTKAVNLSKIDELINRVNTICLSAGVVDAVDRAQIDLTTTDLNGVLDALNEQLQRVEKKNTLNAIKKQQAWLGDRIPDKSTFDTVSVHLRNKWDEFKPETGLTPVATSAGGLYKGTPITLRWEMMDNIGKARSKILPSAFAAIKVIDKFSPDYSEKKACREVYCFHVIQRANGHENVAEVYEVGEDDQNVYIVMELLEGEQLLDRVSRAGSYNELNAAAIISQVVEALAFIHSLQIIHRDVKAENFVFAKKDSEASLKLLDFGVSYYSNEYGEMRADELIGSPLYVAPEMWRRETYDQQVDMFSLGILSHVLLTGTTPFDCTDIRSYVAKIMDEEVSLHSSEAWQDISPEGTSFVSNLLEKSGQTRMSSREALHHPWLAIFEAAPEQSRHLGHAQKSLKRFATMTKGKARMPMQLPLNLREELKQIESSENRTESFANTASSPTTITSTPAASTPPVPNSQIPPLEANDLVRRNRELLRPVDANLAASATGFRESTGSESWGHLSPGAATGDEERNYSSTPGSTVTPTKRAGKGHKIKQLFARPPWSRFPSDHG